MMNPTITNLNIFCLLFRAACLLLAQVHFFFTKYRTNNLYDSGVQTGTGFEGIPDTSINVQPQTLRVPHVPHTYIASIFSTWPRAQRTPPSRTAWNGSWHGTYSTTTTTNNTNTLNKCGQHKTFTPTTKTTTKGCLKDNERMNLHRPFSFIATTGKNCNEYCHFRLLFQASYTYFSWKNKYIYILPSTYSIHHAHRVVQKRRQAQVSKYKK